jgi:hypothetical protein
VENSKEEILKAFLDRKITFPIFLVFDEKPKKKSQNGG